MHTMIKITLMQKSKPLREYHLDAPARCVVGRSHHCTIQVPLIEEFADVSRRHCRLEIEPDLVRVRDLRSANGTYVNGAMIGRRDPSLDVSAAQALEDSEAVLEGAGEIRLGRGARLVVEFVTVAEDSVQDMQTVVGKPAR